MNDNPLLKLEGYGQSIWLDFLRRSSITSGEIQRYIDEDGLSGITSNPSIFEKAIGGSHDYDSAIRQLAQQGKNAGEIFRELSVEDIQNTADLFRPTYDRLEGRDGFVSLEVSPLLAHNTRATIEEGRALWAAVDRPNLMIKVPATPEGMPAIQQLIGEGINVNITLLFGLPVYRQVIEAYLAGLESLFARGKFLDRIASVASFFLSRIDVLVDPMLEKIMQTGGPQAQTARELHGQIAIASAKVAYSIYQEVFTSPRFQRLEARGARPQRLLWASTSTKNPNYLDVMYVEPLIGQNTINTVPVETLNAYRNHGQPASRLTEGVNIALKQLEQLKSLGIDIDQITLQLENEGVDKFIKAFDQLMASLQEKRDSILQRQLLERQMLDLEKGEAPVTGRLAKMEQEQFTARLWRKDYTLWKKDAQARESIQGGLGWLHVAEKMEENLKTLTDFASEIQGAGFRHILHMGMGGSSLAPLVFARTFKTGPRGLPLTVLDTTDPDTILDIEHRIPLADTLFIIASKSGATAEPEAFGAYFYERLKAIKGDKAGQNFVAITDPGTPLVREAGEKGYRRIFLNFPDIGGRYSALSYFGLVPAALMGLDVSGLLSRALRMIHACSPSVKEDENPGIKLGAALGELTLQSHDKVTFIMPQSIATLGTWLEQLLAESTGKEGAGLLPVAGEPVGAPAVYGKDRLFVQYRLKDRELSPAEKAVSALRADGQPVITIQIDDPIEIGQEFFRWEFATAVAGSILGINAFDQPNVQESKENTNRLLKKVHEGSQLNTEKPALVDGLLKYYTENAGDNSLHTLQHFFDQGHPGDYIAILAYLPEKPEVDDLLQSMRVRLRDSLHLATTLGYGPRYLHSTGQYHKGGPNSGLFILLTVDDRDDVRIPGEPYTFGQFKQAQALGDLEALRKHGRRVLRIHLGQDASSGLQALKTSIDKISQNIPQHLRST